jgi:DNA-binding LacI/PurR family transcriptional regulator
MHTNWYSHGVLQGLDEAAAERALAIEMMGSHAAGVEVLSRRLQQSRSQMVVVMAAFMDHAFMIGEAKRIGVPCIVVGTRMLELGLPSICEDGAQGMVLAVRHLVAKGHRRIGLALNAEAHPLVFQRRKGYIQGLAESGLGFDERLIAWLEDDPVTAGVEILRRHLREQRPTALVLSAMWPYVQSLGRLIKSGEVRVPQDLSLVCFDQAYAEYDRFLGIRPTVIQLPIPGDGPSGGPDGVGHCGGT